MQNAYILRYRKQMFQDLFWWQSDLKDKMIPTWWLSVHEWHLNKGICSYTLKNEKNTLEEGDAVYIALPFPVLHLCGHLSQLQNTKYLIIAYKITLTRWLTHVINRDVLSFSVAILVYSLQCGLCSILTSECRDSPEFDEFNLLFLRSFPLITTLSIHQSAG